MRTVLDWWPYLDKNPSVSSWIDAIWRLEGVWIASSHCIFHATIYEMHDVHGDDHDLLAKEDQGTYQSGLWVFVQNSQLYIDHIRTLIYGEREVCSQSFHGAIGIGVIGVAVELERHRQIPGSSYRRERGSSGPQNVPAHLILSMTCIKLASTDP